MFSVLLGKNLGVEPLSPVVVLSAPWHPDNTSISEHLLMAFLCVIFGEIPIKSHVHSYLFIGCLC